METLRTYFDHASARCIVGFALCWAWIDTALVGLPSAQLLSTQTSLGELTSMVSVVFCIGAYALCYLRPTFSRMLRTRKIQWLTAAAACLGTALVHTPNPALASMPTLIGLALAGVAMALLVLMWAEDYASDPHSRGYIWVAGSIALSFPLYLFATELSHWLRIIIVAGFPLASCALLRTVERQGVPDATRPPLLARGGKNGAGREIHILGFSGSLAFWFFAFGFVFGIMQRFSPATDMLSPILMDFQQGGRALAAVVFFVGLYFFSWKPHTTYRISTIIVLGALVVLPIFGSNNTFAAGFIAHTAYGFFECMTWSIIFETMRVHQRDAGTEASAARLLSALGLLGGTLVILVARDVFAANALQMQSILSSAVCMLVVSVMMVLGNTTDNNVWAMMKAGNESRSQARNHSENSLAAGTARLGERCGLTDREMQILALLAEGRSSPYISEELLIGVNTVNTHKRRIYQKLGIHNKQELIDKVRHAAEDGTPAAS